MGRPPCCDKLGVKKGPWTPEEDIMLVTYVQQHGPGNWRQVPTNTGLRRCSKSCRLRWTNYLRPGIRRGDFTHDEEKMIIQLQALLGNKWAAIASYLPERTDNDIKNYWNTHLKKKLRKQQQQLQVGSSGCGDHDHHNDLFGKDGFSSSPSTSSSSSHCISRGQWEKRLQTDIHMAKQALNDALSLDNHKPPPVLPTILDGNQIPTSKTQTTTTYASSTENIAKLLKGFMKITPKNINASSAKTSSNNSNSISISISNSSINEEVNIPSTTGIDLSEALETIFGFDQSFGSPNDSGFSQSNTSGGEGRMFQEDSKLKQPFTMFENWLLDEGGVNMKAPDLTNFGFDENPDFFAS